MRLFASIQRRPTSTLGVLLGAILCFPSSIQAEEGKPGISFARDIRPLLARYCFRCHGTEKIKADLSLARFEDEKAILKARAVWKQARDVLHAHEMPPVGQRQPTPAERGQLTSWIETMLGQPDEGGFRDPGPPIVRRLNRVEYNNTICDLFGFRRQPTYFDPRKGLPESIRLVLHRNYRPMIVDLPPDDVGEGYATIGEVLSLPPFLMERYLTAARQVVEYLDSVRSIERRIQIAERDSAHRSPPTLKVPEAIPTEYPEHVCLLLDLLVLGLRTDSTRVVTFMLNNEAGRRSWPEIGIREGHHDLAHLDPRTPEGQDKLARLQKIDRFYLEQLVYLLCQLEAAPEGEGTLLDSCMILYGSGLAWGRLHNRENLPILLAGGGGGTLQGGRHVRHSRGTPLANLYLSLLERVGVKLDRIADSTGRLPGLTA